MTNWQRLEQVISWTGFSTHAFSKAIGLKRSENLYQIKRGSFGISKELARLITLKYPQISYSWLLTGEGSMMGQGSEDRICAQNAGAIPYYDIDVLVFLAHNETSLKPKPLYHITIPTFSGADFAAKCSGNSMAPYITNGVTAIFKQTNSDAILMGEAYLIVTSEFAFIRYVRCVENDNTKLLLVPENTDDFDEMIIDKTQIQKLYVVKGIIQSF